MNALVSHVVVVDHARQRRLRLRRAQRDVPPAVRPGAVRRDRHARRQFVQSNRAENGDLHGRRRRDGDLAPRHGLGSRPRAVCSTSATGLVDAGNRPGHTAGRDDDERRRDSRRRRNPRPSRSTSARYGEEVLSYADRIFITGGLRYDGNSAFGSGFSGRLLSQDRCVVAAVRRARSSRQIERDQLVPPPRHVRLVGRAAGRAERAALLSDRQRQHRRHRAVGRDALRARQRQPQAGVLRRVRGGLRRRGVLEPDDGRAHVLQQEDEGRAHQRPLAPSIGGTITTCSRTSARRATRASS